MSNNSRELYRKCAKCGKSRSEDQTVTYHRFPDPGTTNITKARAWAVFCWPDDDWSSTEALYNLHAKHKILCGRHFESDQFYDSARQKLSRFAVPKAPEIEQLLNKENVFVNIKETEMKSRNRELIEPLSQIENIPVISSRTPLAIPGTSKSSAGENKASVTLQQASLTSLQNPVVENSVINSGILPSISVDAKKKSGILHAINARKISDLTAKEIKLYNICKKKVKEIARLRQNLKKRKVDIVKSICENESVEKLCNLNIKNSFALLLQSQLKNAPKKPKGRRYSIGQKIMALVIYKKSPACYRLLRRMFTLPCQSSLNKLLNKVPLKPGLNKHIFASLKKMTETQSNEENICILSFDEMSLRKHLYYDRRLDLIQGYQDHGNHGRTDQLASKALVFMLAGIRKKWKQPIAFYLSHTLSADRMTVILKEILTECFLSNLNVVATVCDMSTINVKTLKTLGCTTREPFFVHGDREIVTIFDPPHLLKCTRNLFLKYDIECTSSFHNEGEIVKGVAKWSHIKNFYDIEQSNPNFVFAPALTENHLNPNVQQKMRVKLAAQVFSHSVTAGILAKIASNELPNEAHATACVLQKFDELFDSLNADSQDLRGGKKFSTNITSKSPHLAMFGEMKKFIADMKYIGIKSNPPSQEGWIHTMNAVERLWKNLNKFFFIKSLSPRRLNQDALENCFGCIRYSCGSNHNPTIPQFIAGIKTAVISNLKHAGKNKNCEDDSALLTNNLASFLTSQNINEADDSEMIIIDNEEISTTMADAAEHIDEVTPESQACGYVCGFIFKKLKNNDCVDCKKIFLSPHREPIHIFTSFKEYEASPSLNYMSTNIIKCVETMASIINGFLNKEAWTPNIKSKIFEILNNVDINVLNNCETHKMSNILHVKCCTFFICIKRFTILKNREIEDEKHKALERKMNVLANK